MDPGIFLIQLLNSVQYGLLLFLVASGLTLIFGIMGILNLAHGSFYMIGAYLAFSFTGMVGNFWLALALGLIVAIAIGFALEWLLFQHLYHRDHLYQVLLTYGLILVFEEVRSIIWGKDVHGVEIPEYLNFSIPLGSMMSYPVYSLAISAICALVAIAMYLVLQRTRLGMMIRAGAVDRQMVSALGIDIALLYRVVFACGVALAALAGMVAAPASSVFPGMGHHILIASFVVVVIGGLGSVRGALVAALLIGMADTFGKVLVPQVAGMTVYLLMALVLLWRPQGLFR